MTENNLGKGENEIMSFLKDAIKEADKLCEENKELKTMNTFLEEENGQIHKELKTRTALQHKLEEENEQLKSTIKDVVELLSEEVDLFSDKATEHDICAYIELRELDNKDAYYMAISTKKAIQMLKELEE